MRAGLLDEAASSPEAFVTVLVRSAYAPGRTSDEMF